MDWDTMHGFDMLNDLFSVKGPIMKLKKDNRPSSVVDPSCILIHLFMWVCTIILIIEYAKR